MIEVNGKSMGKKVTEDSKPSANHQVKNNNNVRYG